MSAEICPVCQGSGKWKNEVGFPQSCHGCNGKGWINPDGGAPNYVPVPYPYTPPFWYAPQPLPLLSPTYYEVTCTHTGGTTTIQAAPNVSNT